jgi:hypothetical protein
MGERHVLFNPARSSSALGEFVAAFLSCSPPPALQSKTIKNMRIKSVGAAAVLAALPRQARAANVDRHNVIQKHTLETVNFTAIEAVYTTFVREAAAAPTSKVHVEHVIPPTTCEIPTEDQPLPGQQAASSRSSKELLTHTTLGAQDRPVDMTLYWSTASSIKAAPSQPPLDNHASKSKSATLAGKRGIAHNDALLANAFGRACESCAWAYNWASVRGDLDSKYSFVPMLWGDKVEFTSVWESNCENAISSGSTHIFSFNELDHAMQADLDPVYAAQLHAKHMNKFSGRIQIGAPSVTNSGNTGEGLAWLKSFMDACDVQDGGCAVDFCNVHWYSPPQHANTLFEHLEKARDICNGKKVWLTEFAPIEATDEQLNQFIRRVIPQLDDIEHLEAYSYFMVAEGSLMSSVNSLSSYGRAYATV